MASVEPDPPAAFDAAQMLGYLAEVDELLVQAGTTHEVHLYVAGGAVIATKTDSRLTGDVDVISEGMTPQLRAAVEEVSQRHRRLRSDWLNDGAKLKRVNVPLEPERIFTGRRLIVDSAGDRYVLAMKLISHRQVDEADCEMLIRSLGITSQAELLDLIEQASPRNTEAPLRRTSPPTGSTTRTTPGEDPDDPVAACPCRRSHSAAPGCTQAVVAATIRHPSELRPRTDYATRIALADQARPVRRGSGHGAGPPHRGKVTN